MHQISENKSARMKGKIRLSNSSFLRYIFFLYASVRDTTWPHRSMWLLYLFFSQQRWTRNYVSTGNRLNRWIPQHKFLFLRKYSTSFLHWSWPKLTFQKFSQPISESENCISSTFPLAWAVRRLIREPEENVEWSGWNKSCLIVALSLLPYFLEIFFDESSAVLT